ncbi:MAG: 23S rRNA (guanosine(2251)-2'-O)-methyltransferase RlmB [Candidatus Neomarinimicrobiota bacterium]
MVPTIQINKKNTARDNNKKTIFTLYGLNGALEVLREIPADILSIYVQKTGQADKDTRLKDLLKNKNLKIIQMEKVAFSLKYPMKRTQGIVITFRKERVVPLPPLSSIKGDFCVLALDRVEDPQNLGQIIRTAECAGVDGILITRRGSSGITETVLQVSQGAFCHLPVYESANLNQALTKLKKDGFWIVGVENGIATAQAWHSIDLTGKVVLVLGSEGKGMRRLTLESCDFIATIPVQGAIDSMNVSAAASAVVFERLRQLQSKNP